MSLQTVIDHLKQNIPGQSEEWYQRVATEIREANGNQPKISPERLSKAGNVVIPVHPETRKRLINMCGGDRRLAERLAGNDTQGDWVEAIRKLERDRR